MSSLDADTIRQSLGEATSERLADIVALAEIDSTNSYLMQQQGPSPGHISVAVTNNQTRGRGRHGRVWQSPPGSGLALSLAYTFARQPDNLSALTLALGLGAIDALEDLGVTGVQLKWPNDLVANDAKLGGILTETQARRSAAITVVTGIGINIELGEDLDFGIETDWARRVADLAGLTCERPSSNALTARLVDRLGTTFVQYEAGGFASFGPKWKERDWLLGRALTIDTPQRQLTGVGAGIDDDGALLVDSGPGAHSRITSGSVVMAGSRGSDR